MSWNDFYRRRDLLEAVLNAAQEGHGRLALTDVPGAAEEFGTETNLLLALHHRWSQLLTGHLRAELSHARDGEHADAVARGWQAAAGTHPTLRAVLDQHLDTEDAPHELRAMRETDLRTLAIAAGMARPEDPAEEVTRIGATFLSLTVEAAQPVPRPRRSPVEHLRKFLAPTG